MIRKKTHFELMIFEFMLMQWVDKDGKTPLIVACMDPERFISAKTLIELGANVNAYRPGMLYMSQIECFGLQLLIRKVNFMTNPCFVFEKEMVLIEDLLIAV